MGRPGAPVSDDTILRHLKRRVADRNATTPVRVAGIDDWSWRKGSTYGAIVVDLERREVVDVLPDRSAAATANWLRGRPEVEVCSPKARVKGLRRPVRSPTDFISCRISDRRSRGN